MNNMINRQNMSRGSYIRILHASPDAPPVDIYANGVQIASNLAFKEITDYLAVPAGTYNVEVYPAGTKINPVIDTDFTVPVNSAYTIAATGPLSEITLLPIREVYMPRVVKDKSYVRFTHLSPNAPAVDITLPDGTKLFSNVAFKEHTPYKEINPGTYTLLVKPAGSNEAVLTVPNVVLKPGAIYTINAVGLAGGNPPLEAILVTDSKYQ